MNIRRKPSDKIYAIQVFAMRSIIKIFRKQQEAKKIKNQILENIILLKLQNQETQQMKFQLRRNQVQRTKKLNQYNRQAVQKRLNIKVNGVDENLTPVSSGHAHQPSKFTKISFFKRIQNHQDQVTSANSLQLKLKQEYENQFLMQQHKLIEPANASLQQGHNFKIKPVLGDRGSLPNFNIDYDTLKKKNTENINAELSNNRSRSYIDNEDEDMNLSQMQQRRSTAVMSKLSKNQKEFLKNKEDESSSHDISMISDEKNNLPPEDMQEPAGTGFKRRKSQQIQPDEKIGELDKSKSSENKQRSNTTVLRIGPAGRRKTMNKKRQIQGVGSQAKSISSKEAGSQSNENQSKQANASKAEMEEEAKKSSKCVNSECVVGSQKSPAGISNSLKVQSLTCQLNSNLDSPATNSAQCQMQDLKELKKKRKLISSQ